MPKDHHARQDGPSGHHARQDGPSASPSIPEGPALSPAIARAIAEGRIRRHDGGRPDGRVGREGCRLIGYLVWIGIRDAGDVDTLNTILRDNRHVVDLLAINAPDMHEQLRARTVQRRLELQHAATGRGRHLTGAAGPGAY